jgi:hypothetical protein
VNGTPNIGTLGIRSVPGSHKPNNLEMRCAPNVQRAQGAMEVGVGMMIAHSPLHGSGQAVLPHPPLASDKDARAAQGIGMTDRRQRQSASDQAPHAIPKDAAILASLGEHTAPEPPYLEPKQALRRCVHGHPVIARVSTHDRLQPLTLLGDGFV